MSVDLRGSHIGVSEQLLNSPEICPTFEKMGRVGVPERMRMEDPAVFQREPSKDPPHVAWGHAPPSAVHEQRLGRFSDEHTSGVTDITGDRAERDIAERHASDLRPFAEHRHCAPTLVDISNIQSAALTDTETGAVQQLEDGAIAQRAGIELVVAGRVGGLGRVVEQVERFGATWDTRETASAARRLHAGRDIAFEHAAPPEEPDVRAHRRGFA